ncbi:MAG: anti-sigma regulatory factor [Salinivirgaceae bacterium]|jgi:serine/threonine-protein kinase RsbT|nr:anti-sigma regulatory factor [Salinivirgaceae bacterium]
MKLEFAISGGDFSRAGIASSEVKKMLKKINVEPKIIKRVVVALYEAEVNVCAHAYKGNIFVEIDGTKIKIDIIDKGPGIENIDEAMKEGYSTASDAVREMGFGAGMGLSNMKKNADEMSLESKVDEGTKVTIINYLK